MERVRREPATWKIQRFSKSNRIAVTGLLQRCTTKLASWACKGGKRGHAHLASRDACSRLAHTARPSRSRCSAKDCTTFSKSSRVARPPAQLLPGCCSVERQTCIPGLYRGKEGAAISGACFSPRAQAHTAARSRSAAVECERLHNSANSKSALKP